MALSFESEFSTFIVEIEHVYLYITVSHKVACVQRTLRRQKVVREFHTFAPDNYGQRRLTVGYVVACQMLQPPAVIFMTYSVFYTRVRSFDYKELRLFGSWQLVLCARI